MNFENFNIKYLGKETKELKLWGATKKKSKLQMVFVSHSIADITIRNSI